MPSNDGPYPSHARSKVHRYMNRAVYDYEFIHEVIKKASVVHVAFPPSLEPDADPFPAILPMIGTMGRYEGAEESESRDDRALDIYLHGYVSSRLMRLSSNAADGEGGGYEGLPLTVSATLVDGIVLSLTPNSHSYNYRSAVLQGFGTPVTDEAEKLWAMRLITNSVVPDRWENSRVPPTDTEKKTTQILKVRVVSASGKHRKGGPNDEKFDMQNHEMRERVWTGFIPVWEAKGAPIKADTESKSTVPSYITTAVDEANANAHTAAVHSSGLQAAKSEENQGILSRLMGFANR